MKSSPDSEKLIQRFIDGELAADELATLQLHLRNDPAARQTYYELLTTDQLLVDTFASKDSHFRKVLRQSKESPRRPEGRWLTSLTAAAAVLLIGLGILFFVHLGRHKVEVNASADCHYLIDGVASHSGPWEIGSEIDIRTGVAFIRLNKAASLCLEGPARATLTDADGSFEITEGKGWVQSFEPEAGFVTTLGGATVHHIGTSYGVIASPVNRNEVHLAEGKVEVRWNDATKTLEPGDAIGWLPGRGAAPIPFAEFVRDLPSETTLFSEDFSDSSPVPLHGKSPDVGSPWIVAMEKNQTLAGEGVYDSSGGYRKVSAGFRSFSDPSNNRVYLITLATAVPRQLSDKSKRLQGRESIVLWGGETSQRLLSLTAGASDGHQWHLTDETGGQSSGPTGCTSLEKRQLTIVYDTRSQTAILYEGASARGRELARLETSHGEFPHSIEIENHDGGDLALSHVAVRVITYPEGD